ncbi:uncharacterized protein SOCE26_017630 [Sorangium cellulosum]|uniref:Uncharacterized protein n=1 Tax=Sorangium cellulosum TaxID=56 RepID=A0A2L0EM35_SORCE|nr:hypothetical protein [Sorangium cellulosum]AUX40363.1 uncharacterized protein SOCE26_017630 [Sorangium cellulosum]
MRRFLLLIAACALCACSEDLRPVPQDSGVGSDAGPPPDAGPQDDAGPAPGGDAGPDAAPPASLLERPGELPRPPAGRLPDDLKPPVR